MEDLINLKCFVNKNKEDIEMILVGMPYLPSGEKGTQAKGTEQFIQRDP